MNKIAALFASVVLGLGLATAALADKPSSPPADAPTKDAPKDSGKGGADKGANKGSDKASDKIDINTATADQLKALPGIGDARAADIIKNRPYDKKDQLVSRKVLTQSVYDKIKDQIVAKQPSKDSGTTPPSTPAPKG